MNAFWQRLTDPAQPPMVVAELSGNHMGQYEQAEALVRAAARAGADAVKLQTYTADSMTLPLKTGDFVIQDKSSLWYGRALYELYQQASTPWDWHEPLFRLAESLGMVAFSSPFDADAVRRLSELQVPCLKIASFELTDRELIRSAARSGLPLILSTGMATLEEVTEAVSWVKAEGNEHFALLKCTSRYPAAASGCDLRSMQVLADTFQCPTGYSDHTVGPAASVAASALGARFIEKHLVLDCESDAVDAAFSADPASLAQLVQWVREAWQARGEVRFGNEASDASERQYRRSLYIAKDLAAGERLSDKNLRIVRPEKGLPPKYYEQVLGRRVVQDIKAGTPLSWELLMPGGKTGSEG